MRKITLLLLLLPFAALAQNGEDAATIKKISDEILRNGRAYDLLHQLTKDIGGRLAGSPQFAKAVQWGKITMEQNGADNVFLQGMYGAALGKRRTGQGPDYRDR